MSLHIAVAALSSSQSSIAAIVVVVAVTAVVIAVGFFVASSLPCDHRGRRCVITTRCGHCGCRRGCHLAVDVVGVAIAGVIVVITSVALYGPHLVECPSSGVVVVVRVQVACAGQQEGAAEEADDPADLAAAALRIEETAETSAVRQLGQLEVVRRNAPTLPAKERATLTVVEQVKLKEVVSPRDKIEKKRMRTVGAIPLIFGGTGNLSIELADLSGLAGDR
ncbi:hypothetical protein EDB84DRAFT_1446006 [Lactarius hengduanensis]|nr:hypothetical protein EDB84DRAFT_1446006 [Lactarius hengduanensis]